MFVDWGKGGKGNAIVFVVGAGGGVSVDENDNGRVDGDFGACGAFGMFIAVVTPVLLMIEGCNIFLRSTLSMFPGLTNFLTDESQKKERKSKVKGS